MRTLLNRWICALAWVGLTACGGGSDQSTSPLATYIGSWISSCTVEGSDSEKLALNLNTFSNNTLSGQAIFDEYAGNTTCAGTVVSNTYPISMAYDGIKIVSSDSAVKVIITSGTVVTKDLLLIKGGLLYSGVESSIGADGYPDAIDFTDPLARN